MQLDRQNVDVNLHPIWMMRYWNEKWYKLKDELRKTMQSLQWKFKTTCSMRVGNSRLTFRWCKLNHRSYVEWNSNIFSLAFQEFWTYNYIEYRYLLFFFLCYDIGDSCMTIFNAYFLLLTSSQCEREFKTQVTILKWKMSWWACFNPKYDDDFIRNICSTIFIL